MKHTLLWGCCAVVAMELSAQTMNLDSLEMAQVVWWGDLAHWTSTPASPSARYPFPSWTLNASAPGPHVLWGCPVGGGSEDMDLHFVWEQMLQGSDANRSTVQWSRAPDPDPSQAARLLVESHLAGWLDDMGSMSAGQTGSQDPLTLGAPQMNVWEAPGGCHQWGQPFQLEGKMSFNDSERWIAQAWDQNGRSTTLVDTALAVQGEGSICLGFEVHRTSSHHNDWRFGWSPSPSEPAEVEPNEPSVTSLTLVAPDVVEALWGEEVNASMTHANWTAPSQASPQPTWADMDPNQPGTQVTLVNLPTSCGNLTRWTLPVEVPLGSFARLTVGTETHNVWRDGASKLVGQDLAFTEIMADPTPAMHAPETHYLEVLNVSPWAFDPTQLSLEDQGIWHGLLAAENAHHPLVLPGQHWLIVQDLEPWTDSIASSATVVKASGWSGLRDDGETVQLCSPDGLVLETLSYDEAWWTDQDGISLSSRWPSACDHPSVWQPDPEGASPGREPTFDVMLPPQYRHPTVRLHPSGNLELSPATPWDPRFPPVISCEGSEGLQWAQMELLNPMDEEQWWRSDITLEAHGQFQLKLDSIPLCLPHGQTEGLDTVWQAHRPPEPGDIRLSEILPRHHPVADAEFVEWINASSDTLSWANGVWAPGQCLVQATAGFQQFAGGWGTTPEASEANALWEIVDDLRLTNASGSAILVGDWGEDLAHVQYHECGYSDPTDAENGRSMVLSSTVRQPDSMTVSPGTSAWSSSSSEWGMSPGWLEESSAEQPPLLPLTKPQFGIWEDHWAMTVPQGWSLGLWQTEHWTPETSWDLVWLQGTLMARSDATVEEIPHPPQHVSEVRLSFPEHMDETLFNPNAHASAQWNECLLDPLPSHAPFLEIKAFGGDVVSTDWHWSSSADAQAGDFAPVGEVNWWVPRDSLLCLATCPGRVKNGGHLCVPAQLPSLHGDRILSLSIPQQDLVQAPVSEDMHSPWVMSTEGLSLMRVPHSSHWTSSPSHVRASPGKSNHAARPVLAHHEGLDCLPRSLQPGGVHGWDATTITWTPPTPDDSFHIECRIQAPERPDWVQIQHANFWKGPWSWSWRGEQVDGSLIGPGTYVVVVEWESTEGLRGVDKCLVAVGPP